MEVKSNRKCKERNIDTGYKYLDLGKKIQKLVERYDKHIEEKNDLGWDLEGLKEMYTKIGERFTKIGNKLVNSI